MQSCTTLVLARYVSFEWEVANEKEAKFDFFLRSDLQICLFVYED